MELCVTLMVIYLAGSVISTDSVTEDVTLKMMQCSWRWKMAKGLEPVDNFTC